MLFLNIVTCFLPWRLKLFILVRFYGYKIDPSARIGLSYVYPEHLHLERETCIGHFNLIKGLALLSLSEYSLIGNLNWITGFPRHTKSPFFVNELNRFPALTLGEHSAITHRHLIDCTSRVSIGCFSIVAGYETQILSHSIDPILSRQVSRDVSVGDFCFIGSRSIFLPGSSLPSKCIVAAGAVIVKPLEVEYTLYAGVPAKSVKRISMEAGFFSRKSGYVE